MLNAFGDRRRFAAGYRAGGYRAGLTMLEVIFAMMVILIGMVAVGLLIPLAGRQAADSYQITQGLAAGESALRMLEENRGFQPSPERPWCVVDSGVPLSMASLDEYYNSLATELAGSPTVANLEAAALVQNTAIGDGFCIDPLFWGAQPPSYAPPTPEWVREVFPFWQSDVDPATATPCLAVPRLRRVSFLNGNGVMATKTWLPQASAARLASMFGGDLVPSTSATNRALPPTKGFYASGTGSLMTSPSSSQNPTWMITMTPADTTPVIPTGLVNNVDANTWTVSPVFKPKLYDVSVVIFSKRDPGEITTSSFRADWQNNLPRSERPMTVTFISPEAINSGSFEIELNCPPSFDTTYRLKVGTWLMMSRMSYRDLIPRHSSSTPFLRQVHRWYRVVAVEGTGSPPVRVRVIGKPWGPTEGEVEDFRIHGRPYQLFPASGSSIVHAAVLQDVVQVYEQQIAID